MSLTTWETGPAPTALPGAAVVRLPPLDELARKWVRIEPLIRKATRRTGCFEPIDLLQMAMAGQVGIWVCEVRGSVVAAIVSEVKVYPRRRVLEMLFCGGSQMRLWLSVAIEAFDTHARQLGCSHLFALGRSSWARAWQGELTGDVAVVRDLKG